MPDQSEIAAHCTMSETASLAIQVRLEFALADVDDIGRGENDMAIEPSINGRHQPHEPNFPSGSTIPSRYKAKLC
jgi:hypothetical protein